MYKFFGEKNKEVKNVIGNIVFRFDSKGEFITDDPALIERTKSHFDYIEMKAEVVGEKVKVAIETPKLTITNNLEKETKEAKFKCKKCDYATDDQGELMRHYKDHKKEA